MRGARVALCRCGVALNYHSVQERVAGAQVEQGLLWLWPESGADAWLEASAKPPVTTPEMADTAFAGAQADFAFMENPASLQVMLVSTCERLDETFTTVRPRCTAGHKSECQKGLAHDVLVAHASSSLG